MWATILHEFELSGSEVNANRLVAPLNDEKRIDWSS